jgi:hypothetical protein
MRVNRTIAIGKLEQIGQSSVILDSRLRGYNIKFDRSALWRPEVFFVIPAKAGIQNQKIARF